MKMKYVAAMIMASVSGMGLLHAQEFTTSQLNAVQQVVEATKPAHMGIGSLKVNAITADDEDIVVDLSENYGDVPFTVASINQLKNDIKQALGAPYLHRDVQITIAGNDIEQYFTDFENSYKRNHSPFITEVDPNRHYNKGLDGNIVALWPSHGWYFEPYLNRWEWQRARMFQTVEDMYTHSYVIPFLMPMLENAGAYVWDARERDTHNFGAVVDNDGGQAQHGYNEHIGKKKWETGKMAGFAFARETYKDFENPFTEGTFRQVQTEKDKKKVSTASWDVEMPEAGNFAVYISYKSLPNSSKSVLYTVNSLDGARQFHVDQSMGGGVWVYLGTFQLAQGLNKAVVTVSNLGDNKNEMVTADAIRVGGGKGNIVRRVALPTEENKQIAAKNGDEKYLGKEGIDYKYMGSGDHPWFHLGSRYYLQWAGFPHEVYSTSNGINDYVDDYRSRGEWVNYLAGGSDVLPGKTGLNIPVDVSFCLHTDAGTTPNDDIIGTLLIYCTKSNGKNFGKYANGTPREISRQFANIVSTEVVNDIRSKYEPNWTRRGMWDRSYYEARVPEVPALLMELLSHQNYADMKYGLDPQFRFDVSRSIYKGMLKFIAQRDHRDYVVQPLAVNSFSISAASSPGSFLLTWKPTTDELCGNAQAKKYVVCERVEGGGFKEIAVTPDPRYVVNIKDHKIHSYRIIAMNDGGRSFPSETLSLGMAPRSKGTVMVVNGFTRVSGPDWFDGDSIAGFYDEKDHGVPYMEQINYLGSQHEFRRSLPWRDDDAPGFGACRSNHETEVIAGNTFDYTTVHGESLMKAGYSFVSSSVKAIESDASLLSDYKTLDLILGKQKEVPTGRGVKPSRYKAFTPALREVIQSFTQNGGNVMVSGAYVGTDIWDKAAPAQNEIAFAQNVLGYTWVDRSATLRGEVYTVPTLHKQFTDGDRIAFCNQLNSRLYAVESPDAIKASDDMGATFMRYSENNIPAAIVSHRNGYRTVVMGFPFEVITDAGRRDALMSQVMNFFAE
ncbi:MAG: N-acetylmuramoyl-L-alanine amidase [Muribaculaceae bacterium]|nr:N-acetylmuramoyl-L-alanine amidase [Muribaculaceae bacterium]